MRRKKEKAFTPPTFFNRRQAAKGYPQSQSEKSKAGRGYSQGQQQTAANIGSAGRDASPTKHAIYFSHAENFFAKPLANCPYKWYDEYELVLGNLFVKTTIKEIYFYQKI